MLIARSVIGCAVGFLQKCYGAGNNFRRRNDLFDAVDGMFVVVIR